MKYNPKCPCKQCQIIGQQLLDQQQLQHIEPEDDYRIPESERGNF